LLSKKVPGWMNVAFLGRGARFKHASRVIEALRRDFRERGYQHLIFSGDATTLAFEREFELAADWLGVHDEKQLPAIAVPGNHDLYTRSAATQNLFDVHFSPWLQGQRVDKHLYPFAKKVDDAWLIAVNSSTANWWSFDASGEIGTEQLKRLETLCSTLGEGPRILVTHYPLRAPKRKPERRSHRLRDHVAALETAKKCKIAMWLHGHIHKPYILEAGGDLPFHTLCAGSGTQTHRWCYNDYTLEGDRLLVRQRVFNPASQRFGDGTTTELKLILQ
jgi:3',5'-cyclic AMP phosphodiesterase CpdA